MPVRFLIEDTNDMLYALHIDDEGRALFTTPEDEEIDPEVAEALTALGLEAEITDDFQETWAGISESLVQQGEWHNFLEEVRAHGTTQRRWRGYSHLTDMPGKYTEYIYDFEPSAFAGYLGTVLGERLKGYRSYADELDPEDVAKLIAALRNNDESKLEFDIEDGSWHEESQSEPTTMWSCVDRSITADGEELFEYCVDFSREMYDPITFESEADPTQEHGLEIAGSYELRDIIEIFGLEKKEEKLDEVAAKEALEPYHPDPSEGEGGEWGVYYKYTEHKLNKKTGEWEKVLRTKVVPYWAKYDAVAALEIINDYVYNRDSEDYHEYFIVRRISEEEQAQLQQAVKDRKKERDFWKKQGKLFDIDTPPPITFDPEMDVWEKWEEEEEQEQ